MKKVLFLTIALLTAFFSDGQFLSEFYKKGAVILEEDVTFGTKNNWKELFSDIGATRDQGMDGKNKNIVVAPDGTVYMSHRSRHSISLFDKNGNFVKEFGKKGGKESDFVYMPTVIGIMDGKYLATYAVDGRMLLFDLNGTWVKTVKLDFMPLDNAILKDGKVAILGHTSWTNKTRRFVAIKDLNSGESRIIWDQFQPHDNPQNIIVKNKSGGMSSTSLPFTHPGLTWPRLLTTPDSNLALVFPETGDVRIYSSSGKEVKSYKVNAGERLKISQQDREAYYNNALKRIQDLEKMKSDKPMDEKQKGNLQSTIDQLKEQVKKYLDESLYPGQLPALSQVMFDSDNNLLVFSFTKEKDQNRFFVYAYDHQGQQVAESSFSCDKYKLDFSRSKFVFYHGKVIAVQRMKDEKEEVPVRLVRFNLKN